MERIRPRQFSLHWILALLGVLLLLPTPQARAETCATPELLENQKVMHVNFEYRAVVLPAGAYGWNEATEFYDEKGNAVGPRYFFPGMPVKAQVCPAPVVEPVTQQNTNFPIAGLLLELKALPPPEIVELQGAIESIATEPPVIVVAQTEVGITTTTQIRNSLGEPLTFGDLAVGDEVFVKAVAEPSENPDRPASLLALVVVVKADQPALIVIEGRIRSFLVAAAIYQGAMMVDGHVVIVGLDAPIVDADGSLISFADLKVGDGVRVEGQRLSNSTDPAEPVNILAKKVKRFSTAPPQDRVEGHIAEINDETGCFMLARPSLEDATVPVLNQVCTTDATTISDKEGNALTFADLNQGDRVMVVIDVAKQEAWTAVEIVRLSSPPTPQDIVGRIAEIKTENKCFGIAPGLPGDEITLPVIIPVCTSNATVYRTEAGEPLAFEDFAVDDLVRIVVDNRVMTPVSIALEVILLNAPEPPSEVEGILVGVEPDTRCVLIGGFFGPDSTTSNLLPPVTRVCTSENTVFRTVDGEPLTFEDFKVQDRVVAILDPNVDQSQLVAAELVLLRRPIDPVVVEGAIESVEPLEDATLGIGIVGVEGLLFLVTDETNLFLRSGEPAAFDDLQVGMRVRAIGLPDTASALIPALEIRILDQNNPDRITVDGAIEEIAPMTGAEAAFIGWLRVQGVKFMVSEQTVIRTGAGEAVEFSTLAVGDLVLVEGFAASLTETPQMPGPDALYIAQVIVVRGELPPPPPPALIGTIVSIEPDSTCFLFHIPDVTPDPRICATEETVIRNKAGESLTFADLKAGARVLVRVQPLPTPVLRQVEPVTATAVEIVLLEDAPEHEAIAGLIQAILPAPSTGGVGIVVVKDIHFLVVDETNIVGPEGVELAFADLKIGMLVRVFGATDPEKQELPALFVAARIEVLRNHQPVPVRLQGVVESIDAALSQFVVQGTLVQVGGETKIFDADGNPVGFDALAVETFVKVEGWRQRETTIVNAAVVRIAEDPVQPGEVEFRGVISEIDAGNKSLVVAGRVVIATDTTTILDRENQVAGFDALRVGQFVEVEGLRLATLVPPAMIEATKIEIEGSGCLEFNLEGVIDSIEKNVWTVAGKSFVVNDQTRYHEAGGEELEAADFAAGDFVRVHGCAPADGLPVARNVVLKPEVVEPACRPDIVFAGPVEAIDPDAATLTVGGKTILVTSTTELIREGVGPITLADITLEDVAVVGAIGLPEATEVEACFVRVKAGIDVPPPQEHRVVGRIDAIDTNTMTLTVRERTVLVTDETKIVARRDVELAFEDLAVGQLVDARGRLDADNVLVAAVIRVQEENQNPRPLRPIFGQITALDLPTSFSVNNKSILVNDATEYAGLMGETIEPAVLVVGDAVMVLPNREASDPAAVPPVIVAERVKLRAAIIEAIDLETSQVLVAGGPVSVVETTKIVDMPGETELTLADLSVGDLVKVVLAPIDIYPPQATLIIRVNRPEFSGPIDQMGETKPGHHNGHPSISSPNPENTFGFISMPLDMAPAEPNTLYEVNMRISTDVEDPYKVPTARVRVNMTDFEKGATLVINSLNTFSHVPTPEGRDYSLLFVPPAETFSNNEGDATFFASLDLLSFERRFAKDATLSLDAVEVVPVPLDRVQTVATLLTDEFVTGSEGWVFGSGGDYTAPRHGIDSGNLALVPNGSYCFGYWTKDTGVVVEPGKIYRARYMVRTNIDDPTKVPTFRLRLNTSSFELGTTVNIDATDDAAETLRTDARVYDVYFLIPANDPGTDTILASVDLLSFSDASDLDALIAVEQFILEEVEITD